jgi:hypothetical protein
MASPHISHDNTKVHTTYSVLEMPQRQDMCLTAAHLVGTHALWSWQTGAKGNRSSYARHISKHNHLRTRHSHHSTLRMLYTQPPAEIFHKTGK